MKNIRRYLYGQVMADLKKIAFYISEVAFYSGEVAFYISEVAFYSGEVAFYISEVAFYSGYVAFYISEIAFCRRLLVVVFRHMNIL